MQAACFSHVATDDMFTPLLLSHIVNSWSCMPMDFPLYFNFSLNTLSGVSYKMTKTCPTASKPYHSQPFTNLDHTGPSDVKNVTTSVPRGTPSAQPDLPNSRRTPNTRLKSDCSPAKQKSWSQPKMKSTPIRCVDGSEPVRYRASLVEMRSLWRLSINEEITFFLFED